MADPTLRDVLAELATLREKVAASERARARPKRHPRWASRLGAALVLALLLASVPVGLTATDRFPDVPTANPHHDDVNQIAQAGITIGFPDGTYKPDAFVTRGQMASFLARTAGLGGRAPVVNARTAQTAADAATVGGFAPAALVRVARADGPTGPFPVVSTPAYTSIIAVTITAPGAGFVLVSGSHATGGSASANTVQTRLRDTAMGGAASPPVFATVPTGADEALALSYVFQVADAGARTYVLEASLLSGAGPIFAGYGALTALFVPFGSTGGTTLGVEETPPATPLTDNPWGR